MRRRRLSLLALVVIMTAALYPGAAVFARANACQFISMPLELRVRDSSVIAIAEVTASDGTEARLTPRAYLKGPAQSLEIKLLMPSDLCSYPPLVAGQRVLVALRDDGGVLRWPEPGGTYVLRDGRAISGEDPAMFVSEAELVAGIRSITGQYAVPAESNSEGAGIDWVKTVIPLTAALLVVFAIGLVLMRKWHEIDPS